MIIKKCSLLVAMVMGCLLVNFAHANNQTVSIGYAQSKVKDFKNIRGVNVQYRYEWNSPFSILSSFSYMKSDKNWSFKDEAGDFYHRKSDVKNYSLLVGPAYRFNEIVSLYGLIGLSRTKNKGYYQWINSVGGDTDSGHEEHDFSKKSTNFAYGVGMIINPIKNITVNIGYEGTRADIGGTKIDITSCKVSINGFVVGIGYRF